MESEVLLSRRRWVRQRMCLRTTIEQEAASDGVAFGSVSPSVEEIPEWSLHVEAELAEGLEAWDP